MEDVERLENLAGERIIPESVAAGFRPAVFLFQNGEFALERAAFFKTYRGHARVQFSAPDRRQSRIL